MPVAAAGVARFDFAALCATALGAGDYLALATHFHCLVLDGIPRLSPANFDAARRFIVLIDALYDHRVKLVASAEAGPDQLYERGEGARMFERTASRLAGDAEPGLPGAAASDLSGQSARSRVSEGLAGAGGSCDRNLPPRLSAPAKPLASDPCPGCVAPSDVP